MSVEVGVERGPAAGSPALMSSGDAVTAILRAAGIRRMYAVPGESFLQILDAVEASPDLTLVSTRHESGAAFMAEADAKLTGVPAIAAGTRAVGAANLAIGVHTAFQDSTPMIVIVGQVDTSQLGHEAFQEVDIPAFYSQVTKWGATVHRADRLPELLAKAILIATTGRRGPVVLALPSDVLAEDIPHELVEQAIRVVSGGSTKPTISRADAADLAESIARAARPVLIVGDETNGESKALTRFAEQYGLGVYTAWRRHDGFPNEHAQYLGHLALATPPACLDALTEADLVIVLGTRLDEITTQGYTLPLPGSRVVHVHSDPAVAADGVFASLSITAATGPFLQALLDARPEPVVRDWSTGHAAYLAASTPTPRTGAALDPAAVVAAMIDALPRDAIVTSDAGNFASFAHLYWRFAESSSQLSPTSGAMGYGVPAAIAAAIARPDRTVVAVCGDGGFLMSGQEVETAVRLGLDLLVVVFRNGLYGTIAAHQARAFGRTAGVDIGEVDLAGFASSLGATGLSVHEPVELEGVLRRAAGLRGVRVVDVRVDPELIAPARTLSELLAHGALEAGRTPLTTEEGSAQ